MELCRGGDLFGLIRCSLFGLCVGLLLQRLSILTTGLLVCSSSKEYQKQQEQGVADAACSFELTQFYTAELVNAFEYMHSQVLLLQQAAQCTHHCLCASSLPHYFSNYEGSCCSMSSTETLSLTTCSLGTLRSQLERA